jgi:hypothetical protein
MLSRKGKALRLHLIEQNNWTLFACLRCTYACRAGEHGLRTGLLRGGSPTTGCTRPSLWVWLVPRHAHWGRRCLGNQRHVQRLSLVHMSNSPRQYSTVQSAAVNAPSLVPVHNNGRCVGIDPSRGKGPAGPFGFRRTRIHWPAR